MKKIILIIAIIFASAGQINSQEVNGTINNDTIQLRDRGADIHFGFKDDVFRMGLGFDCGKYWHFIFNGESYSDYKTDIEAEAYTFGLGLNKRHPFGNLFLISGRIYPYLGWAKLSNDDEKNTEFTYVLSADISFGIRLFKGKNEDWYLTGGYYITSPEFETEGMFDNGSWGIGLSVLM